MLRFIKGSLRQLSCSWYQLRLRRKSGSCKICFPRFLQGINQPHEFLHGVGQGDIVVFSFGTFLGKVFSKDRIPVADILGCVVKGMSQVARTTFFHVSVAVCEFSRLVCRWRAAGVSKNFVRRTEIGEISDFCKDHSSGVYSHTGNRKDRRI